MKELQAILSSGLLVKLTDSQDNSWDFGIKTLLVGYRLLCDLLDLDCDPPDLDAHDLKLSVSIGILTYIIPVQAQEISQDGISYRFKLGKEYELIQRREHYRLDNPQIAANCVIHGEDLGAAKVTNISGGGIGLIITRDRPVKTDTLIELQLTMLDGSIVRASVRAAFVAPADEPDRYMVGAQFKKISSRDEARIIKCIFDHQAGKKRADIEGQASDKDIA